MPKYLAVLRFEVEFEADDEYEADNKVNAMIDAIGDVDTGDMHWPDIDYNILVEGGN